MTTTDTWNIGLVVPAEAVGTFEAALGQLSPALSCFELADTGPSAGLWRIDAVTEAPPDRARLAALVAVAAAAAAIPEPAVTVERVVARDWIAETMAAFPPFDVGRFFVHGSHWHGTVPPGRLPLLVDAGSAFGTGEHHSTRGCLLALDLLARRRTFARPLDMGCGSGILAMAIARLWHVPVRAADVDLRAVQVTTENARCNGLGGFVGARMADGFSTGWVARAAPFDLVTANILARPLMRMAAPMARSLAPGAHVVLAGLLARQERMVLAAYRAQGLVLDRRLPMDAWVTLILRA